jgi:hypothetical protein
VDSGYYRSPVNWDRSLFGANRREQIHMEYVTTIRLFRTQCRLIWPVSVTWRTYDYYVTNELLTHYSCSCSQSCTVFVSLSWRVQRFFVQNSDPYRNAYQRFNIRWQNRLTWTPAIMNWRRYLESRIVQLHTLCSSTMLTKMRGRHLTFVRVETWNYYRHRGKFCWPLTTVLHTII